MEGAKWTEALLKQGLHKKPLSVSVTVIVPAHALPAVIRAGLPFVFEPATIACNVKKRRIAAEYSADGGRFSR